ncbi:MAG: ATPase [Desulfovibrionaceae bacterium]|nr:ATPase [Desulfovibrionaceae bacterium]
MRPLTWLVASFLLLVLLGALLLMLPEATVSGSIPFIDALFTSTSAVCVTGLVVVDTGSYFTPLGQTIIMALIQVGGLGVMTISVALFRFLGRGVSFRQRMLMQSVYTHTPRQDILVFVKSILVFTAFAEGLGAALLFFRWSGEFPLDKALFLAVFHSVSAFCNAGFALFSDSLVRYGDDALLNLTVCGLIVVGGIGFPVLHDLLRWARGAHAEGRRPRLTLQTKAVLATTAILTFGGAAVFWILEHHHAFVGMPKGEAALISLFQSVTARTAGFNTIDLGRLSDATVTLVLFLMFFGASPGSCGGGVKTTTLAVLAAYAWSRVRRNRHVTLFKRRVPTDTVNRSITLTLIAVGLIGAALYMILAGNAVQGTLRSTVPNHFLVHLFEAVSAFGTVGLSLGGTALLTLWGKCWIILLMLVGRVGVLSFAYVIVGGEATRGLEYAQENIMIG